MKVLVGTTVAKNFAYALGKFLQNQKEIQNRFPNSELVISTDNIKFVGRLNNCMEQFNLKGKVIYYKTQKPSYANDRSWSIAQGREAVRQYAVKNNFDYLLSVDADMIYSNSLIQILLGLYNPHNVVQSGYKGRLTDNIGFGLSCTLLKREIFEKMVFRCLEYKNGHVIEDGNMFDYDLMRVGAKVKKGVFLSINHYLNTNEKKSIYPQKLNMGKRFMIHPVIRYLLVKLSIILKYDICSVLQRTFYKIK